MSDWRPISEYPIKPDGNGARGPCVLARDADKNPFLVMMAKGHFFICPGTPIFYADHQCSFMTISNLVEFMEIPE